MPTRNAHERRRWNDEGFAAGWQQREGLTAASTAPLLARACLRPGERVLDVGCGSGASTLAAADAVAPGGEVLAVDFSEPLLAAARRRIASAGVGNVSFLLEDAETASFELAPFDAAISQLGVLFFEDSVEAFANLRRQLRRGGRLVFTSWQGAESNPWHVAPVLRHFVDGAAKGHGAAAGDGPGPFRFGDARIPERLLAEAGFSEIEHEEVSTRARLLRSAAYDPSMLAAVGVPPERAEEAEGAVAQHLEQFRSGEEIFELPLAYAIWSAVNR